MASDVDSGVQGIYPGVHQTSGVIATLFEVRGWLPEGWLPKKTALTLAMCRASPPEDAFGQNKQENNGLEFPFSPGRSPADPKEPSTAPFRRTFRKGRLWADVRGRPVPFCV